MEFEVLDLLASHTGEGAEMFNFFFSLVWLFGIIAIGFAMAVKVITRS